MTGKKSAGMRLAKISMYVLGFLLLGALYYWLLPVAMPSRLSADHVRYAFGSQDLAPTAANSLSSLWTAFLELVHATGLTPARQEIAVSAALSGWVSLAALAILACSVSWGVLILVALTPAVLWSAVVPNGTSLVLLLLSLMAWLSKPSVRFQTERRRWTLGAFIDGLGMAMTPVAWLLVFMRLARRRGENGPRVLRAILTLMGLSFPFALGILLEGVAGGGVAGTFSALPIFTLLRSIPHDDILGAALVITGGGGEQTLSLLASIAFFVGIAISDVSRLGTTAGTSTAVTTVSRARTFALWILLVMPLAVVFAVGSPKAWRLAHPGWSTIIEDFALNVHRSVNEKTIAITRTATEEAAIRFVEEILEKPRLVTALRLINLFERSTFERVHALDSRFLLDEARRGKPSGEDAFKDLVEMVIVPNVNRGTQFWLEAIPDRNDGLQITFGFNGLFIAKSEGSTRFIAHRDQLRNTFVRSRLSAHEFVAGPSLEAMIFERHAVYHLAVARIIEREKKTVDWERRARAEYYAALKKVEWLKVPYQKVCIDPAKEEAEARAALKPGDKAIPKSEPLDICNETAWFHKENPSSR